MTAETIAYLLILFGLGGGLALLETEPPARKRRSKR
jgi:hypothetical protein